MWRQTFWAVISPLVVAALIVFGRSGAEPPTQRRVERIRVGYVATLINAPVLVGLYDGDFQEALGEVAIESRMFGAGPALVEALFAGEIDLAYIGPNPALNAWIRSEGQAVRIVAGSTLGGSGFVVQPEFRPQTTSDYVGKRLGTPQIGNTQDIALRTYLRRLGVPDDGSPGSPKILAPGNPEVYAMFVRGELDGAWVAEPWLARLVDAGGTVWIEDHEQMTSYVLAEVGFLRSAPSIVADWLRAHIAVSQRLNRDPHAAAASLAAQLSEVWQERVQSSDVMRSLARMQFAWDVAIESLARDVTNAYELGLLGARAPDIGGIYDSGPLTEALSTLEVPDEQKERVQS